MSKIKKMPKFYKKEKEFPSISELMKDKKNCYECNEDFSYPTNEDEKIEDEVINHLRSEYVFWKKTMDQAVSLIDGVTEIVAIFKPKSPAQSDWKSEWLTAANKILRIYESNKDDNIIPEPKNDEWENTDEMPDDKTFFYHLRDYSMRPMVTVCVMRMDGVYSRGVSICSQKEMPVKAVGRDIAYERAKEAQRRERDELPVNRNDAWDVLQLVGHEELFDFKSAYSPTLTVFEEKLFGLTDKE